MRTFKKAIIIIILPIFILFLFLYREYNLKKYQNQNKQNVITTSNTQNTTKDEQNVICTEEYSPVCWVDWETYSNSCVALKQNKVWIKHDWICTNDDKTENATGSTENQDYQNIEETWSVIWNNADETISQDNTENTTNQTGSTNSWNTINWEKVLDYYNSNFSYWFNIPYNTYYSGYWSRDGASHTVWISTGTWSESFEDSQIKVYFYKNKIIDELKDSHYGYYKKDGKIYLQVWNSSVVIESNSSDSKIEKIADIISNTIYEK